MPIDIKLPALGDGVDSGSVLEVLVKEGDMVARDQGLLELETGKATVQVPSTQAGKVLKVHVAAGQEIPIGATLVTLESAAAESPAAKPAPAKPAPAKPAPAPVPPPKAEAAPPAAPKAAPAPSPTPAPPARSQPAPVPAPAVAPATVAAAVEADEAADGSGIAAGPAVRRFAREVGVDLRNVSGTGVGGRVTREDVLQAVRTANQVASSSAKAKGAPSARDAWGPVRIEKLPKIRKTIAQQMHKSWTTAPRVTNFDDADVTDLERLRASSKDDYAKKGIKLTALPFVIKSVAMALRQHPTLNASIDMENDQVVYKDYVNIGVAVDTDRGLVVPSLRGADELSIPDIARALATVADNVRDSNFSLADLQGSTFTISNLGAIGGTYSTPIINVPEVAILLIGKSRQMPVVIDGQIQIRLLMPLSLSYDHRLVDGAAAARFLNEVIGYLKAPSRLLLAP